ncbi:AAA family ATPase [Acinetobacter baumannii]|nr:AAA family ATPase [Acinetobacter baumannii]EKX3720068.1 AAA family ATPase [Acinetobacter baumannii]EKX3750909.1 AAA family ATPase [Acinetobacter baumannii]
MKINSLEIKDVGGIPYLKLESINSKMNIICGVNGVGKTNILDSIAYIYSNWSFNQIKKRYGSEYGQLNALVYFSEELIGTSIGAVHEARATLDKFEPQDNRSFKPIDNRFLKQIIYLRTMRDIQYKPQKAIESDPDEMKYGQDLIGGISSDDLKTWFISRFYQYSAGNLENQFRSNFELALSVIGILNSSYSFKTVNRKNEIIINTPSGEIYFEYLSSGFKSTLFIILGIIKDIEYRFQSKLFKADDYDGLILIDEIELHLHPEWQGQICKILKQIFTKAQFFVTTHSPHVVQTAECNEVIALQRNDDEVVRRELPGSEYGYQGWTIEEVLKDVMGMKDLRTELYDDIRKEFIEAFRLQKKEAAEKAFNKLSNMLHPTSELKAIYQMQLESLGE